MTSYSNAGGPADALGRARWQGSCGTARWKPLEIAAIVVGFVIWWPVGLALLGVKFAQRRGYKVDDAMSAVRGAFGGMGRAAPPQWRPFAGSPTGNAAFDEWRHAELAKLDEERRRIDAAQREFADHLDNLRKARDREEFEGFMRAREQSRPAPEA